jgi:hypothetical protein
MRDVYEPIEDASIDELRALQLERLRDRLLRRRGMEGISGKGHGLFQVLLPAHHAFIRSSRSAIGCFARSFFR